jgi:hypothetical protein
VDGTGLVSCPMAVTGLTSVVLPLIHFNPVLNVLREPG